MKTRFKKGSGLPEKFKPPQDPLETEKKSRELEPRGDWKEKKVIEYFEKKAQELGIEPDEFREKKKKVFQKLIWQLETDNWPQDFDQRAKREYIIEFVNWMLGKSHYNSDLKTTPWGRSRLVGDSISDYIETLVGKKTNYELAIQKLRCFIPSDIDTAWLYFKFIVTKVPKLDTETPVAHNGKIDPDAYDWDFYPELDWWLKINQGWKPVNPGTKPEKDQLPERFDPTRNNVLSKSDYQNRVGKAEVDPERFSALGVIGSGDKYVDKKTVPTVPDPNTSYFDSHPMGDPGPAEKTSGPGLKIQEPEPPKSTPKDPIPVDPTLVTSSSSSSSSSQTPPPAPATPKPPPSGKQKESSYKHPSPEEKEEMKKRESKISKMWSKTQSHIPGLLVMEHDTSHHHQGLSKETRETNLHKKLLHEVREHQKKLKNVKIMGKELETINPHSHLIVEAITDTFTHQLEEETRKLKIPYEKRIQSEQSLKETALRELADYKIQDRNALLVAQDVEQKLLDRMAQLEKELEATKTQGKKLQSNLRLKYESAHKLILGQKTELEKQLEMARSEKQRLEIESENSKRAYLEQLAESERLSASLSEAESLQRSQVQEIVKKIKEMTTGHAEETEALETKIEDLEDEVFKLRSRRAALEQGQTEHLKIESGLNAQLEGISQQMVQMQNELDLQKSRSESLERQITQSFAEENRLKEELGKLTGASEEQIQNLQKKINEMNAEGVKLLKEKELSAAHQVISLTNLQELKTKENELITRLQGSTQEIDVLRKQLEQESVVKQNLHYEIQRLKLELMEKQNQVTLNLNLQEESKRFKNIEQNLMLEVQEREKRITQLEQEASQSESSQSELNESLWRLKEALKKLHKGFERNVQEISQGQIGTENLEDEGLFEMLRRVRDQKIESGQLAEEEASAISLWESAKDLRNQVIGSRNLSQKQVEDLVMRSSHLEEELRKKTDELRSLQEAMSTPGPIEFSAPIPGEEELFEKVHKRNTEKKLGDALIKVISQGLFQHHTVQHTQDALSRIDRYMKQTQTETQELLTQTLKNDEKKQQIEHRASQILLHKIEHDHKFREEYTQSRNKRAFLSREWREQVIDLLRQNVEEGSGSETEAYTSEAERLKATRKRPRK